MLSTGMNGRNVKLARGRHLVALQNAGGVLLAPAVLHCLAVTACLCTQDLPALASRHHARPSIHLRVQNNLLIMFLLFNDALNASHYTESSFCGPYEWSLPVGSLIE